MARPNEVRPNATVIGTLGQVNETMRTPATVILDRFRTARHFLNAERRRAGAAGLKRWSTSEHYVLAQKLDDPQRQEEYPPGTIAHGRCSHGGATANRRSGWMRSRSASPACDKPFRQSPHRMVIFARSCFHPATRRLLSAPRTMMIWATAETDNTRTCRNGDHGSPPRAARTSRRCNPLVEV